MGKIWMLGGSSGAGSDDCTAGKAQVLAGHTAVTRDSGDEAAGGTMPDRGAWASRIGVNGRAAIPAGYHNGGGYVDQAITDRGAVIGSLGINGTYMIPEGYHNGAGRVTQSIPTMGAQTVAPGPTQKVVQCSGRYMTGDITIQGYGAAYDIISVGAAQGRAQVHTYNLPGIYVMFDAVSISHYGTINVSNLELSSWVKAGQTKDFGKYTVSYDGATLTITGKSDMTASPADITINSGTILCCRSK